MSVRAMPGMHVQKRRAGVSWLLKRALVRSDAGQSRGCAHESVQMRAETIALVVVDDGAHLRF